jgi:AraC-like DNA-binding protein
MSYDYKLLCEEISLYLHRHPSCSLAALSRELGVSPRTIQQAVNTVTGKGFRNLRGEILVATVKGLLISGPTLAIKELSFQVGYRSPRSFARAIRHASGVSPQELRSSIAEKLSVTPHLVG